jgi:hypothetical protein
MNRALMLIVAFAFAGSSSVSLAGIAPSHNSSQMSQSGAKIAAPKKTEEDQRKEESQPPKDEKR